MIFSMVVFFSIHPLLCRTTLRHDSTYIRNLALAQLMARSCLVRYKSILPAQSGFHPVVPFFLVLWSHFWRTPTLIPYLFLYCPCWSLPFRLHVLQQVCWAKLHQPTSLCCSCRPQQRLSLVGCLLLRGFQLWTELVLL
jgi:hypothetical protein